jgi:hypothetical protein
MGSLRAFIRHPLASSFLALVIFAICAAVVSRVFTGSFTRLFLVVPWWAWTIVILALGLVGVLIVATTRYRVSSRRSATSAVAAWINVGGSFADYRARIATLAGRYHNVDWQYRGRAIEGVGSETQPEIDPDSIEVVSPPLCPNCKTGLQEKPGLVGGHIWRCVGCGWRKRSSENFTTVATQAELYFQGRWRKDLLDRGVFHR